MYEVSRELSFAAAHHLRECGGKCEALHGHNWRVRVTARAQELDQLGMVVDFKKLKAVLEETLEPLDHHDLNAVQPFDQINPSAEHLARYVGERVARLVNDQRVRIHRCEVWESEGSRAVYFLPDQQP